MADLLGILIALDEQTITKIVSSKHDLAREGHKVSSLTISSYPAFLRLVENYVLYHTRQTGGGDLPSYMANSKGMTILNYAFQSLGGIQGAYEVCKTGLRGGVITVINTLAEALKTEEERLYIEAQLRYYCNPISFDDRVALMEQYLTRFTKNLPSGVKPRTALELAANYEDVIETHMAVIKNIRFRLGRAR